MACLKRQVMVQNSDFTYWSEHPKVVATKSLWQCMAQMKAGPNSYLHVMFATILCTFSHAI